MKKSKPKGKLLFTQTALCFSQLPLTLGKYTLFEIIWQGKIGCFHSILQAAFPVNLFIGCLMIFYGIHNNKIRL